MKIFTTLKDLLIAKGIDPKIADIDPAFTKFKARFCVPCDRYFKARSGKVIHDKRIHA